jgi:hypothetical protein
LEDNFFGGILIQTDKHKLMLMKSLQTKFIYLWLTISCKTHLIVGLNAPAPGCLAILSQCYHPWLSLLTFNKIN